ncbi:hypothetical protein [uncultured Porphyromonas sp.]|uniref:hypothetical protein n=1 Tax=uncultured Porphyromonas sp. TaxID=159274 RepID=UPI00260D35F4|nr:hypothetical protein [uncultured Porphyromonas sp.]
MMKALRTLLLILILILLLVGVALYLYHSYTAEKAKEPQITPVELQAKITQRLRLITQEITYRQPVKAYSGSYMAEGVADLVAYVKFDLERLHIQQGQGDTLYVSLPMPQVELGRRPNGTHSIKYYYMAKSIFGIHPEPTSDRTATQELETKILSQAHADIEGDPRFLPQAKLEARGQLQQLIAALLPGRPIIVVEEVLIPGEATQTKPSTAFPTHTSAPITTP